MPFITLTQSYDKLPISIQSEKVEAVRDMEAVSRGSVVILEQSSYGVVETMAEVVAKLEAASSL